MTKEQAEQIVRGISFIAAAQATIALNKSYESTDKAVENQKLLSNAEQLLVELLTLSDPTNTK